MRAEEAVSELTSMETQAIYNIYEEFFETKEYRDMVVSAVGVRTHPVREAMFWVVYESTGTK